MTRSLKGLLTKKSINYTEYTFSTNIGLSDLRIEAFSVSMADSVWSQFF